MKQIETDELRKLQIDILSDVHKFCIKNDINYSLAFGSLLGAVRHKGYIPWDDDIDIMMPRKDYETFLKMYGNERYKIADHNTMASCYLPYAKVYDIYTIVNEHVEYQTEYGVNIDVFPLDNVPDSDNELKVFFRKKERWNIVYNLKIIKLAKSRSFAKNLILVFAHLFLAPISMHKVSEKMRLYSKKYYKVNTKRIGVVAPSDNKIREIWPRELFAEYTILPFEAIDVQVVKKYHQFLTAEYGDYMRLPPENKRVSHHDFDAWWKE